MTFLYPTFLFGLLATAIPVLIHLFNFRRTKRVYFTNVAFLKQVDTTTSSFRQLKHWLVLAARVLAVAALVLAFAQPFIPARSGTGAGRSGVTSLYLDNSLSMQNELDNERALDRAVNQVGALLTAFPNTPTLQLLTNDFSADEYPLQTSGQLRDRLAGVELSPTARSLADVYRRQQNLASRQSGGSNQYFWFSDFQKSTVGDLDRLRLDSTSRLFLVPIQARAVQNVFVDSVWLTTPFIRDMQANRLMVRLRNTGDEAVENLTVQLLLDEAQVSSQIITIAGRGTVTAPFNFTVRGQGFKRGRVTFEDSPVTFDNEYYFVLNAAPRVRVLHLYGTKTGRYVESVFANDSLFAFQSQSAGNVDPGRLSAENLVVLEGVGTLDASLRTSLDRFVRAGGSLLVVPGTQPDAAGLGGLLPGLGVRGLNPSGTPPTPATALPLAEPNRQSPFFADIFDETTRRDLLTMPAATPAWSWQVVGERLLSFRSGQPFLTRSKAGDGQVYVLAAPLDEASGDFARNALFLPTLYKMAALSVRQEPAAYSFRETTVALDVPGTPRNAVFRLRREGLELIPVQRLNGNQLVLELPRGDQLGRGQTLESGYYELLLNGRTERVLAFNHDDAESNLDVYTTAELRNRFANQKNVQVFEASTDADFVQAFRAENVGTPLWKYFLAAALFFLLLEIGLIRFLKS
jgi:hypothetical protein